MEYRQITHQERYLIAELKRLKYSIRQIAFIIGKHKSTIYRELNRNTHESSWGYYPPRAIWKSNERRRKSRKKPGYSKEQLDLVLGLIKDEQWSPEQIANRLRSGGVLNICTETIYKYVWQDKRNGGTTYKYLRQSPKKRRKGYNTKDSRGILEGKRGLDERPISAKNRSRKGHYEIDLVHGKTGSGCILTAVDRKTKITHIRKLKDKTKLEVNKALIPLIKKHHIKTISADNGTEWHGFREIEKETNIPFYFAKPYHSWERGTNENTNGLIRQYFPKSNSLESTTQRECDDVALKLNSRPRKILNFKTPNEVHFGISNFVALLS